MYLLAHVYLHVQSESIAYNSYKFEIFFLHSSKNNW